MSHQPAITTKRKLGVAAVIASLITAAVCLMEALDLLPEAPDRFAYDWKVSLFSTKTKEQRTDISLVYIDENSLSDYFYKTPVDRGLLAELIRAVDAAHPKVIGLDFIFDHPSEPERDEALLNAIRGARAPIVMVATDVEERGISSKVLSWQKSYLSRTNRQTASPFLGTEDTSFRLGDDVIRSMEPFYPGSRLPFAVALAHYKGVDYKDVDSYRRSRIIDWLLPSPEGKEAFQTFVVPPHKRVTGKLDGEAVLPAFMKPFLKEKIVIIESNMIGVDRHRVPMTIATNADAPGGYIHAQILAQIIDHREVRELPSLFEVPLIFITALLLLVIMEHYGEDHPEILFESILVGLIIIGGVVTFWATGQTGSGPVTRYTPRINFPSSSVLTTWFLVAILGKYTSRIAWRLVAGYDRRVRISPRNLTNIRQDVSKHLRSMASFISRIRQDWKLYRLPGKYCATITQRLVRKHKRSDTCS
jgi:adenylate cyclase